MNDVVYVWIMKSLILLSRINPSSLRFETERKPSTPSLKARLKIAGL